MLLGPKSVSHYGERSGMCLKKTNSFQMFQACSRKEVSHKYHWDFSTNLWYNLFAEIRVWLTGPVNHHRCKIFRGSNILLRCLRVLSQGCFWLGVSISSEEQYALQQLCCCPGTVFYPPLITSGQASLGRKTQKEKEFALCVDGQEVGAALKLQLQLHFCNRVSGGTTNENNYPI